jgi:hypothetical protein
MMMSTQIVQTLMYHRQGAENEALSKCSINSLVNKLVKGKQDELDSLITVAQEKVRQVIKCVSDTLLTQK